MNKIKNSIRNPFLIVLGITQDGGLPHCGCNKKCCTSRWLPGSKQILSSSLAIVDPVDKKRWVIDLTPDFKFQLNILNKAIKLRKKKTILDGVFITHGHVGHYTGLIHFEKSIMNTKNISVYVMPKMFHLLMTNRPWKDLYENQNIKLFEMTTASQIKISRNISLKPFLVPHRDDFTETVGFIINGPKKSVLYIPDIDHWRLTNNKIEKLIENCDHAFLDGTFFDKSEIPCRNIEEIPHPLVSQSIKKFKRLPSKSKSKIHFIHLNHTNPLLNIRSKQRKLLNQAGFKIAKQNSIFFI